MLSLFSEQPGVVGLISLFQKVKRVIGIELCQEAVEDARVNALTNGENTFCITQQAGGLPQQNFLLDISTVSTICLGVLGAFYKVGH